MLLKAKPDAASPFNSCCCSYLHRLCCREAGQRVARDPWAWGGKACCINHSGLYSWVPFSTLYTHRLEVLQTSKEKRSAGCNTSHDWANFWMQSGKNVPDRWCPNYHKINKSSNVDLVEETITTIRLILQSDLVAWVSYHNPCTWHDIILLFRPPESPFPFFLQL